MATLQANINNLNGYESVSIYNEGKLVKTFDGMTENTKLLLRSYDGIGFDDVTIQLTKQPNNNPLMFLLPNVFAQNENAIHIEFAIIPYGFATCGSDESCYHVNVDDKQEFPLLVMSLGITSIIVSVFVGIRIFKDRKKNPWGKSYHDSVIDNNYFHIVKQRYS